MEQSRSEMGDHALLALATRGDHESWEALVRRHAPLVNGISVLYELEEYERADVFQQVWEELWEHRHVPHLNAANQIQQWLVRTTGRLAWRRLYQRSAAALKGQLSTISQRNHPARLLEESLIAEGRWSVFATAAAQLPQPERELLRQLFFDPEHPGPDEIASRLGYPAPDLPQKREACLRELGRLVDTVVTSAPRSLEPALR